MPAPLLVVALPLLVAVVLSPILLVQRGAHRGSFLLWNMSFGNSSMTAGGIKVKLSNSNLCAQASVRMAYTFAGAITGIAQGMPAVLSLLV